MKLSRIITYCCIATVIILGFSFAYLNANFVTINYFIGSRQLPLSLLMALSVVLGGILGLVVTIRLVFRLKRENFKLNQKIKSNIKALNQVRGIPAEHA